MSSPPQKRKARRTWVRQALCQYVSAWVLYPGIRSSSCRYRSAIIYTKTSGSKIITIVGDTVSKIKGSNYIAYKGVKNPYMVTLTVDGIPVPNKQVVFNFKGKTYKKTTNSKGQAFLNINCGKGTYAIKYKFYSIKNAHYASGTSKISVRQGMPTNIIKQTDRVYIHKTASIFKIKYSFFNW